MAKIQSSEYGELTEFSFGAGRSKGPFLAVSICGKPREGQTPGTMQCLKPDKEFESTSKDKFLFSEQKELYFIIMFMRRVRAKYEKIGNKDYDTCTYFRWSPDNKDENYPDGAKIEVIFAGALLDENLKPIMDPIEPDRAAFIYFKNKGTKCGPAFDFIKEIEKRTEQLEHLSDNLEFEKAVVTPRRFITKVSVSIYKHPDYGGMYVFNYSLFKQLPDDKVKDIMDRSKKWKEVFEKQFNIEQYIMSQQQQHTAAASPTQTNNTASSAPIAGNPSFKDPETPKEQTVQQAVSQDFELPGFI